MGRIARIIVVMLVVILAGLIAQPAWAAPPLPASMAAIGDSITRAYDVCCSYGDHPGQSGPPAPPATTASPATTSASSS